METSPDITPRFKGTRPAPLSDMIRERNLQPLDYFKKQLNYLETMAPDIHPLITALVESTFKNHLKNSEVARAFDEIIKADTNLSNAPGCWGFEFELSGDFRRVHGLDRNRVNSIYVYSLIKNALRIGEREFSKGFFIDKSEEGDDIQVSALKIRTMEDPTIRLVYGKKGKKYFMDLPLSVVKTMLEDRWVEGNSIVTSNVELVLEGKDDEAGGADEPHPIEDWDLVNKKMEEPPFIILSLTHGNEDPIRIRERGMFSHINIQINEKGEPQRVRVGFSHATYGVEGLKKFATPLIEESLQGSERADMPFALTEPVINSTGYRWSDVSHMLSEKVPVERDLLMLKFIEKINLAQVATNIELPADVFKFIRNNSKYFGLGPIGIYTLSGLLSTGHGEIFALDTGKPRDLQICLALGGTELRHALKRAIKNISNLDEIKKFWKFWENGRWKEKLTEELKRGKNGHGLVTDLARIGNRERRSTEPQMQKIVPQLAIFTLSGSMTSSLGPIPPELKNHVKNVRFYTAAGETNREVVGIIGDTITEQFLIDPVFATECVLELLTTDKKSFMQFIKPVLDSAISGKGCREFNLKKNSIRKVLNWFKKIERGGDFSRIPFSTLETQGLLGISVPLGEYLQSAGEDFRTRKKIIDSLRAMVFVINKAFELENNYLQKAWQDKFMETTKRVAENKISERVMNMIYLATLSNLRKADAANTKGQSHSDNVRSILYRKIHHPPDVAEKQTLKRLDGLAG